MTDQADTLARTLASYRETPGMVAALLVSHDGLVIAADAAPDFDIDAFAAQAGGMISYVAGLGGELGEHTTKYIAVEFETVTMVLAPFGEELLLALLGHPTALVCQYRINTVA
jgi:predicted regulator of Ras-like GTPase activity (Roadblock/LC7/MglB family)